MRDMKRRDLLLQPAEIRQLSEAVIPASVHGDGQLQAKLIKRGDAFYNPTVYAGLAALADRAARSSEPNGEPVAAVRSGGLAIVAVEVPGRDLGGEYWTSLGENITPHVVALDAIVLEANRRNVPGNSLMFPPNA
jgi:hypothetical protein